jgi:uncharacterized protein (TIGR02231 family)
MKHTSLYFAAGIIAFSCSISYAQTNQKLNIEKATVFLTGAQLESSAKMMFSKGENEVRFSNVAGDVKNESIVVGASNSVVVESVTFQNNYLGPDNLTPAAKKIKDSIDFITEQKETINTKIVVISEQQAILMANRKVSGDKTGLSVAELTKMLDMVNTKLNTYLNEKHKDEQLIVKMDERIAKLNLQLEEEQKKEYQPGGILLVKFYAKEATNSTVNVSYNIVHAGWSPTYDIFADDSKSPVKFFYKANIRQNSGVKWDNVKLSLSTGNPQEGMQVNELSPWYLAFYQPPPPVPRNAVKRKAESAYIQPGVQVAGSYSLSAPPPPAAGWSSGVTTSVDDNSTMDEYVAVDNSGVNTTFDIDLPYTIPSDGQNHLVSVKKYEAPAVYEYFAVPKNDKDAFLQAKITKWEDFNLMPGQTNIFYEGTYIGQASIDPHSVIDTMNISLGRDKKIVIKRVMDEKLRSVKSIGTNVHETFGYKITIRNTRKEAITIEIEDQLPVSNDKDIVLEDIETSNADHDEATGILKWKVTVKPNETKVIPFGYTVKYPKGKRITNL